MNRKIGDKLNGSMTSDIGLWENDNQDLVTFVGVVDVKGDENRNIALVESPSVRIKV